MVLSMKLRSASRKTNFCTGNNKPQALAVGNSKSRAKSKSGNGSSSNSSDGYPNRRGFLWKRRSGSPATIKTLPKANSTSADGSATTSSYPVFFDGQTTEVPGKIRCHRCNNSMRLGLREITYKGEKREYATFRCSQCGTFRSALSVLSHRIRRSQKSELEKSTSEVSNDGYASPGLRATSANRAGHSDDNTDTEGALASTPNKVSPKHLRATLNPTLDLFDGADRRVEHVPTAQLARVDANVQDRDGLARFEELEEEDQGNPMKSSRPLLSVLAYDLCQMASAFKNAFRRSS